MEELKDGLTYVVRKTNDGYFGFIGECELAVSKNMNSMEELLKELNFKADREEAANPNFAGDPARNLRKIKSKINIYLLYIEVDKQINS